MKTKKPMLIHLVLIAGIAAGIVIPIHAQQSEVSLQSMGLSVAEQPFDSVEFDLQDLNGNRHVLSAYRGKVVFLNFWATWCGPCRAEMPAMQRLHEELNDEGLEILAVDIQEGRNQVQSFGRTFNLTFPLLLDTTGRTASQYGIRSIPTTYLIDRSGKVFAGAVGARRWDSPEMIGLFRKILNDGTD